MKAVKWLKFPLFIGLSLGLMYLAFKNQNPKELIQQLKSVDYTWVWASMFFGFLAIVSRGIRWVILLKSIGYNPGYLNSIYAVSIGYFTNIAIPRAGEITRCTSLNQTEKIPVDKLFGTIILERAIDFVFLISLIFLTFCLKFDLISELLSTIFSNQSSGVFTSAMVVILIILLILFLLYSLRSKISHTKFYEKIKRFVRGVIDGFKSINKLKNPTNFWLHTFVIWIMYLLMTYVCFFSINETIMLTLVDGLYTMVIGGLGMVAPVQGGIGAYHYIVKTGLTLLDIPESSALLFATVVHTAQTLMTLLFGGISILMIFLTSKKSPREQ